jgi:hypothetical protein
MTVLAERQVAFETACYEIRWPQTGEILGYLVRAPAGNGALRRALERNGLALSATEQVAGDRVRTGVAA